MVRELDQSKITLRLVEHVDREGKGGEENVVAKLSGPTLQTLQRCLVSHNWTCFLRIQLTIDSTPQHLLPSEMTTARKVKSLSN
jgi:hypothetical protein